MIYEPLPQEMNHDCSEPNIAPPFVLASDWPRSWLVTQIWLVKLENSVVGRMKNILRKTYSQIKRSRHARRNFLFASFLLLDIVRSDYVDWHCGSHLEIMEEKSGDLQES